jgi:hypothetical protein
MKLYFKDIGNTEFGIYDYIDALIVMLGAKKLQI